ncbi:ribonuclease HII [Moheibacter sediminis]|uniref:Ribonuclease HII n=1 Tax=Moheibacter sediminis TaxID=1434700 RepID=A0A1W2C330_9FLAO|nr:ribonuclease HII [Moheibacter sediminis]SMC79434.1 RNase HII [Moheibacter sediminis]
MEKQFIIDAIEAGCDEAGRGCLAGPVFAAAVILGNNFENQLINDSKQLSEKNRNQLKSFIEQNALTFSVAYVEPKKIDEINILNASILAMQLALDGLKVIPENIIVDGNRFKPYKEIPYQCMIKGDARFLNIAAASILAKTYRDEYMENLHLEFPQYNWKKNKGYPTIEHRKGISEFGSTIHHRMSFRLLPTQLSLDI